MEWVSNESLPWAEIRAFMAGRLLTLNKLPGIRPLGCDKTWRRFFAKFLLYVAMSEAEIICEIDQLCGGLHAGIEGGVHAMKTMWDLLMEEEEMGFLLIDTRNAFNKRYCTRMLWTMCHLWPMGAHFTFNSYKHHATI